MDVATAETGILRRIVLREGAVVEAGQVLAQLDDEVHAAVMAEAERSMRSAGRREAAYAEQQLRRERLEALQDLLPRGSARIEEVNRARADLEIATAQLRAVQDELEVRQLEYQRAKQQWERRTIYAPCNGVVVRLFKEEGEFIGPNDPQLMTVMQLDPLLATFAVPSGLARKIHPGQVVRIRLPESDTQVEGTVKTVSPVIEGKSGTIRVEVRVDNPQQKFFSGEPCSLLLGAGIGCRQALNRFSRFEEKP